MLWIKAEEGRKEILKIKFKEEALVSLSVLIKNRRAAEWNSRIQREEEVAKRYTRGPAVGET